jgi:hypothetical protein
VTPFMLRLRRKSSAKSRRSERIRVPMTLSDATRSSRCCPTFAPRIVCSNLGRSCKSVITQLAREGSPRPSLRLPQTRLSRDYNQVVRGQFQFDGPARQTGTPPPAVMEHAHRYAATKSVGPALRPSDQPRACNACRKTAIRACPSKSSAIPINTPTRRTRSGCCE